MFFLFFGPNFFYFIFIPETFANSADPDVMPHITLSCPVMPFLTLFRPETGTFANSEDLVEMAQNRAFHQDLHCLQRQNQSSEKEIQYVWKKYLGTPQYIQWTILSCISFMEKFIGLKRVNIMNNSFIILIDLEIVTHLFIILNKYTGPNGIENVTIMGKHSYHEMEGPIMIIQHLSSKDVQWFSRKKS